MRFLFMFRRKLVLKKINDGVILSSMSNVKSCVPSYILHFKDIMYRIILIKFLTENVF